LHDVGDLVLAEVEQDLVLSVCREMNHGLRTVDYGCELQKSAKTV